MTKSEKAEEFFKNGANCAQAVFMAFAEDFGLDNETACAISSGFGAGMGRMREVCGAVSGMFMAADLKYGPKNLDKAAKDKQYAIIQKLAEEFKKETGSIICRELLHKENTSADKPVSDERNTEYYKKRPCVELVKLAATILEKYISENK